MVTNKADCMHSHSGIFAELAFNRFSSTDAIFSFFVNFFPR